MNILSLPSIRRTVWAVLWLYGMAMPVTLRSQCAMTTPTPIPDDNIIVLGTSVSGLIDANLASPTQGICGVELSFNHEYIGDLTITLFSPAGDSVVLVGPASMGIQPTNLSTWNIDFIACADVPMPDAGFTPVWSNNQMWDIITTYNGSYHPFQGCLEDFNTGPANGIWQLVIEDADPNQIGNLLSYTLIFCNPAGLMCEPCSPNAGTLTPPVLARCEQQLFSTAELAVDYGMFGPPTAEYQYQFLLVQSGMIIQHGSFFTSAPPAGNYTICGLSYHEDDSLLVELILESGDFPILFQSITDGDICAELTSSCVSLRVETPPDTTHITTELCLGDQFIFGGQTYTTPGLYIQTHDGPGACDSVFEIRIGPRLLQIDIPFPDTLSCGGNQVTLQANVLNAPGPFSYLWTTDFGNITSPPNQPSININQAGPYVVSITDGLCSNTAAVNVYADQGYPQVFVEGATLTCSDPAALLEPIFVPTDGAILWNGPGGFSSNQADVTVTIPGIYSLMVTNQQGCSTTRLVTVMSDTATIEPVISIVGADCLAPFKTLGFTSSIPVTAILWTGPNGFISTGGTANVVDPGIYTLQLTFRNGCIRTATYSFNANFMVPDLMVPASDTLNCNEIISLTAASMTPGVVFSWSGPEGFASNQPTVAIDQAGSYVVIVTALNSCSVQQVINIAEGNDLFEFEIFTDTLTCIQDTVPIQVISTSADTYNWLNYNGPDQGMSIIHVVSSGTYEVMMTDTNSGCVISGSIFVPANLQQPSFDYKTDTITCANPTATLEIIPFVGFPLINVYWELPDFTIVQGPTLMSGLVGEHRLYGVGTSGCAGVWRIHIPRDTVPPFLLVESDTLSCQGWVHITSQSLDSIILYSWNGPGIIANMGNAIDVAVPGIYTLDATGVNGCVSHYSVYVDSNYILPQFQITHDSLRCDQPATLTASSTDPLLQYTWFDVGGQILSTDSVVQTTLPGQYILQVQGTNQCAVYDTVTLFPADYPLVEWTVDTISCAVQAVTIEATINVIPLSQYWINTFGDTIGTGLDLLVTDSGPYYLSVTGPNGCVRIDTIVVPVDTVTPNAAIELIGEIRCKERDVMFSGEMSTPAAITFQWTTTGGTILSDVSQSVIDARDTGWYFLAVTNLVNGCMDMDSFHLLQNPEDITGVVLNVIRSMCAGELNGAIEVVSVIGGIGPFLYQMPPGPPQTNAFFDGLGAGQHLVVVTDTAGCEFDTLVEITLTPGYTVNAGEDIEIYLGESVTLVGSSDLIATEIQTTYWDSLGVQLCQDCAQIEVAPWETTTYTFTTASITGCLRSDEVIVYVIEKAKFFLPNVFSPNGDGINDEIRIFPTPGMARVVQWIIFDRWGNAVYGKTNFDPFDTSVFWNGLTTTGETANPGVFPYLLEIQLINGNRELLHGNITLIR